MYNENNNESKKRNNIIDFMTTLIAGAVAISLVYIYHNPIKKEKIDNKSDLTPAFISVQDCDIVYSDGKDSTYICKETEQIKIRPEVYAHFQSLDDKCAPDLEDKNRVVCYDGELEKDKINDLKNRKKIGMTCITSKEGQKLKCIRKF